MNAAMNAATIAALVFAGGGSLVITLADALMLREGLHIYYEGSKCRITRHWTNRDRTIVRVVVFAVSGDSWIAIDGDERWSLTAPPKATLPPSATS